MDNLYRVCYTSKLDRNVDESEVYEIVEKAQEKNASLDISGMLLFIDNNFIQVIEGEEESIRSLYQTISGDGRHNDVKTIMEGKTEERLFPSWTMGYKALTELDLDDLKEINKDPDFSIDRLLNRDGDMFLYLMKSFYENGKLDFRVLWNK